MSGILKPKALVITRYVTTSGFIDISPTLGNVWWFKGVRYAIRSTGSGLGKNSVSLLTVRREDGETVPLEGWGYSSPPSGSAAGEITEHGTVASYEQFLRIEWQVATSAIRFSFHFIGLEGAISSL